MGRYNTIGMEVEGGDIGSEKGLVGTSTRE